MALQVPQRPWSFHVLQHLGQSPAWAPSNLGPRPPGLLLKLPALLFLVVWLSCQCFFKPSCHRGARDEADEGPPNHHSFKDFRPPSTSVAVVYMFECGFPGPPRSK